MAEAVPFAGGEVFNPADFVRITNRDPDSWAHLVGGQWIPCQKSPRARQMVVGRFGGKDYVFPFEKPINVHLNVARHIFGMGHDDKSAAFSRLGWARTSDQLSEAHERLLKISFEDLPELLEATRFSKQKESASAAGAAEGDGARGVAGSATPPPENPPDDEAM